MRILKTGFMNSSSKKNFEMEKEKIILELLIQELMTMEFYSQKKIRE
jgi:hypothetical protein